jgi:hypothetical protein
VPVGTSLTTNNGDFTTSSNGQTVDALDVVGGSLVIEHDNVLVKRCRVELASIACVYFAAGTTGVVVEDCELFGDNGSAIFYEGGDATLTRLNIHGCENGFHVGANNLTIRDCYIHDLDPVGADPHTDGLQCAPGTTDLLVEHCNFALDTGGLVSGGIQMETQALPIVQNADWLVTNNRVICAASGPSAGAVTIRLPQEDVSASNVRFTNNRLMPGEFGSVQFQGAGGAITEWSGNVRDDNDAPIGLP